MFGHSRAGGPARPRDLCCLRESSGSEPHLPSPSSDTTGVGAQNVSEKHIRWLNRRQLLHGSVLCVVERIQKLPETHARMDTKFKKKKSLTLDIFVALLKSISKVCLIQGKY